jgi:hypothetical protein
MLIANDPEKFFDAVYLPSGVRLVEISKMKSDALQACYSHWYKSQEQGDEVFAFKHIDPSDLRTSGKKRKYLADEEEQGSRHITPDRQEGGSGRTAIIPHFSPSASPERNMM